MRCFSVLALVIGLLSLSGCDVDVNVDGGGQDPAGVQSDGGDATGDTSEQQTTADGENEGGGLDLNLPNVNVKIGGKEGVKVSAPGVDVNVNGEDGVSVEAPGTNVEVK